MSLKFQYFVLVLACFFWCDFLYAKIISDTIPIIFSGESFTFPSEINNKVWIDHQFDAEIVAAAAKVVAVDRQTNKEVISLGAFNLIKGSVRIIANKKVYIENVDYQIDYNLGHMLIVDSNIRNSLSNIKFSYALPISLINSSETFFNSWARSHSEYVRKIKLEASSF